MKFQRMLSNGQWIDDDRIDQFVSLAIKREKWLAPRENRAERTARDILDLLATGVAIRYDNDWYAQIRDGDAVKVPASRPVTLARCDCGHSVPAVQVMNASMGTSCPDCYDRMSH